MSPTDKFKIALKSILKRIPLLTKVVHWGRSIRSCDHRDICLNQIRDSAVLCQLSMLNSEEILNAIRENLLSYNLMKQNQTLRSVSYLRDLRELTLAHQTKVLQSAHPNPLNKFGKKCYSQSDEDGLTLQVLSRINFLNGGVFAEFGVGDGTENNTLILKALGWKGFWVGGEALAFEPSVKDFKYIREWITLENIVSLAESGQQALSVSNIDVISLDLDGNDYYFVERLLNRGFSPKLFIVEYNAKFPPPVQWKIEYDPNHQWKGDDYYGASLSSFVSLFERHKYRLIVCNSHSGANAFFIRQDFDSAFEDVPRDIDDIYVPPRYYLHESYGHQPSVKTIERLFK